MAGWAPFLAVVALLALAVLLLARQSQRLVHEYGPDSDGPGGDGPDSDEPDSEGTRRERDGVSDAERSVWESDAERRDPDGERSTTERHGPDSERHNTEQHDPDAETEDGRKRAGTTVDPTASGEPRGGAAREAGSPTGRERSGSAEPRPDGHPPAGSEPWEDSPVEAGPELQLTTGMLLANVAVTQVLVAVIVVVAGWYFAIPADAFGVTGAASSVGPPAVGLGVAFGLALWVGNELATAVADAVGAAYDEAVRGMLAPESAGGWLVLFGLVLPIIAVSEELLFRAALIGVPAAGYGVSPWLLAVVSSVAFALGHGAQGRVGVVVTGALGFVLAAGYVVSGSLLLVIVAHYVINAMEFLVHERLGIEDVSIGRPPTPGA